MRNHFKPEFVNRIDEIVRFHRLDRGATSRASSTSRSTQLRERLAGRGVSASRSPTPRASTSRREGYDPDFGARPLKRVIQREIGDPIALALLEGKFRDGDIVTVDADADGVTLTRQRLTRRPVG